MVVLIHHIRKIILGFSVILAFTVYLYVTNTFTTSDLVKIRLTQYYALIATVLLYLALLASPLYSVFPSLPYKPIYIRARRALGQSVFFFATLHASIAFFGLLGGISGLSFLTKNYLVAISLSFSAYLILSSMSATSFDWAVKKLGIRWKILHRFVYLAALLILVHALMLGTHFTNLSELVPKIYFSALAVLICLEAIRFDHYLTNKFKLNLAFGISLIIVILALAYATIYLKPPSQGTSASLGIHANHIQLAEELQSNNQTKLPNLPGLTGDRTKRYSVSFDHPENVQPGQTVELSFTVFDASNGNPIRLYKKPYAETFHLIIVDSTLNYFNHIHPQQTGNSFIISTVFPQNNTYHLYADFQPLEAIDQQHAFTVNVGAGSPKPNQIVDKNLTKTFGAYEVTLKTDTPLEARKMTVGQQKISFELKDSTTKKPISDLKPYLNSFGHLVMIHQVRYDYLHVHPFEFTSPPPNANGGPVVTFLPIGIYGSFQPGVYRAFAQFNHNGKLFVADFTVEVR